MKNQEKTALSFYDALDDFYISALSFIKAHGSIGLNVSNCGQVSIGRGYSIDQSAADAIIFEAFDEAAKTC